MLAPYRHITPNVLLVEDTCNVYVLKLERTGVAIDFGSGAVLDRLGDMGIDLLTDVLMTHHHRDQGQGLHRAVDAGTRIWVPPSERDLFADIETHWQMRKIDCYYDVRQDRFSILENIPVYGSVPEYRSMQFNRVDVFILPTPGHTLGSTTYIAEIDGNRVAFTGDLIYGPGKVWSLSSLQWTYNGYEGAAATVLSLDLLEDQNPDLLLPAHGIPMHNPSAAMTEVRRNLEAYVYFTQPAAHNAPMAFESDERWDLREWLRRPYDEISPHLLRNRTAFASEHVLLSNSGTALFLDFGFGMSTGYPESRDRSSQRPSLASIDALKNTYGIDRVEVAIPTHYHDDHVAGLGILSEVEGTEVWAGEEVAPILRNPSHYNLPCVWYDPLPVHQVVRHGQSIRWREYELTMYALPGHTKYAVATSFEVDGMKVLSTGDQQGSHEGSREHFNFQYRNGFEFADYINSALLYKKVSPDLMISGHWLPRYVDDEYLDMLLREGIQLAELHRRLLPLEYVNFGAEGFGATIWPYRSTVTGGQTAELEVEARNPYAEPADVRVDLVVPAGWNVGPSTGSVAVDSHGKTTFKFHVMPPLGIHCRRARVAANLSVGGRNFGQHAEALIDVQ